MRNVYVFLFALLSFSAVAATPGRGYLVDENPTSYTVPDAGHIVELPTGTPPGTYYLISLTNGDGSPLNTATFATGAVFTIQDTTGTAVTVLYSDAGWGDGSMLVQIDTPYAFPASLTGSGGTNGHLIGIVPGDHSGPIDGDNFFGDDGGNTDDGNYFFFHSKDQAPPWDLRTKPIYATATGYVSAGILALSTLAALVLGGFFGFWLIKKTMLWAPKVG